MKTRITFALLALAVLVAAGTAWAAQPTVEQPSAENPEVTVPAETGTIVPSEIDGLFVDPAEQGACCRGDCFAQKMDCLDACGFEDQVCRDQCHAAYDACISNC
jgi:hypothetical protein